MSLNLVKKTIISTAAIAALTMSTAYAAAYEAVEEVSTDGAYGHIFAGANFLNSMGGELNTDIDPIFHLGDGTSFDLKTGYNVGVAVGYKSGSFRYEAEFLYGRADLDEGSSTLNTINFNDLVRERAVDDNLGLDGRLRTFAGLANIYYDIQNLDLGALVPYVGLGIGYANVDMSIGINSNTPHGKNVDSLSLSGSDDEFIYQGIVGLSFDVSDTVALTVDYRYVATTDFKHETNIYNDHYHSNTVNAGIAMRFA